MESSAVDKYSVPSQRAFSGLHRQDNRVNAELPKPRGEESDTNLIVNYLPQNMNQETVRALFATIGEVESCKLVRERSTDAPGGPRMQGQSLGYAFVKYYRSEDAQQAVLKLNRIRLLNKMIKVSYARPSSEAIRGANLYVSGLDKSWTTVELEKLFAPFGTIVASRILYDYVTGASKGVGFVRFDLRKQAEYAIDSMNGAIPDGLEEAITVKFANSPGMPKNGQQSRDEAGQSPPLKRRFWNGDNRNGQEKSFGGQRDRYSSGSQGYSKMPPMNNSFYGDGLMPMAAGPNPVFTYFPGTMMPTSGWSLFVFNLPPDTDESLLWRLFGPFGAVQSVRVVRDHQTGKCRRFGFVTMTNYSDAVMSIQYLNGYSLGNRTLQVSFERGTEGGMTPAVRHSRMDCSWS